MAKKIVRTHELIKKQMVDKNKDLSVKTILKKYFTREMLIDILVERSEDLWNIKEIKKILNDYLFEKFSWNKLDSGEYKKWELDKNKLEERNNFKFLSEDDQIDKIVKSQIDFLKEHHPTIEESILIEIEKSLKEHNKLWNKNHKQTIVLDSNPFTGQAVYCDYHQGELDKVREMRPSGVMDLETGLDSTK